MAYLSTGFSAALGVLTLCVLLAAILTAFRNACRLGGIVGRAFYNGALGTGFFFLFGIASMVLNLFPYIHDVTEGFRGLILMPLATLTSLFWFFAFRDLGRIGGGDAEWAAKVPRAGRRHK